MWSESSMFRDVSEPRLQLPYMVTQARICKHSQEQHPMTQAHTFPPTQSSWPFCQVLGCFLDVSYSSWTLHLCAKMTEILMFQYQPWWPWHEFWPLSLTSGRRHSIPIKYHLLVTISECLNTNHLWQTWWFVPFSVAASLTLDLLHCILLM